MNTVSTCRMKGFGEWIRQNGEILGKRALHLSGHKKRTGDIYEKNDSN